MQPDTIAKSLAIGNPADGPYALEVARRTDGAIDAVSDDEVRAGIRLLAETTGIFTETAGGVTTATLAKLAERGDDRRRTSASCWSSPARASRRSTRCAARSRRTRSPASFDAFVDQVEAPAQVGS